VLVQISESGDLVIRDVRWSKNMGLDLVICDVRWSKNMGLHRTW